MTISAITRRFDYTGNGVTVDFSFPRPFAANTDLKVYLVLISTGVATLQVYATNYTVAGAGLDAGGTVTMLVAPSALQKIVIFGDTDATQNLDLDAVTSWPMTSIEYAFDRLTIMVQEIWDRLLRVPFAPREYVNTFDYKLPLPTATYQLGVNAAGTGFEYRNPTGTSWIVAAGAPGVGTGVTGDMYINSTTGDVYGPKTSVWGGIVANIKGPTGASGTMSGPGSSVDNEVVLFNGASGAIVKSAGVLFNKLARLDVDNVHTAGKQTYVASASGGASANMPAGAAPSAPSNGDLWSTTTRLFARLNGVTETLAHLSANIFTAVQTFVAATTSTASLNIPAGVAPSAPTNGDVWSTSTKLLMRINTVSETLAFLSAQTFTGKQTFVASGSSAASINLPHGSAPSSPADGDAWTTTAGLFLRINGVTIGPIATGGGVTRISGNSGAAGADETWQVLTSDYTNATAVASDVMTTTSVGAGVWEFEYHLIYQQSNATGGARFKPTHSGTTTEMVYDWIYADSANASPLAGEADYNSPTVETFAGAVAARASATELEVTNVKTANVDYRAHIKGTIVVTVSGSLILASRRNAAGTITIKDGSNLVLKKIA